MEQLGRDPENGIAYVLARFAEEVVVPVTAVRRLPYILPATRLIASNLEGERHKGQEYRGLHDALALPKDVA